MNKDEEIYGEIVFDCEIEKRWVWDKKLKKIVPKIKKLKTNHKKVR